MLFSSYEVLRLLWSLTVVAQLSDLKNTMCSAGQVQMAASTYGPYSLVGPCGLGTRLLIRQVLYTGQPVDDC